MYLKTVFRTSTAPRAAIILIPWLFAYSGGSLSQSITDGYWESVTGQSSFLLTFSAPACAACAAWEGARVKRSGMLDSAPSRTPPRIAVSVLWPVILLGVLSILLGFLFFAPRASGFPRWSSFVMLIVEVAVVVAHTAAGYTAGLVLPRLLAAPAALIASFLWMAYPTAINSPAWLRQLNGRNFGGCCGLDQVPDPRGFGVVAAVAAGVTIACVAWIGLSGLRRIAAPLVLGTSLVAACLLAAPMGLRAGQPRDLAELDCQTGSSGICLWPEQRQAAKNIEAWGSAARRNLLAAGVRPAQNVLVTSAAPPRRDVLAVVAFSAVPNDIPPCARTGAWPGSEASGPVEVWLLLTAGASPQEIRNSYIEADVLLAQKVRGLPLVAQQRWYQHNFSALTRCDRQPDLDPERLAAGAAR